MRTETSSSFDIVDVTPLTGGTVAGFILSKERDGLCGPRTAGRSADVQRRHRHVAGAGEFLAAAIGLSEEFVGGIVPLAWVSAARLVPLLQIRTPQIDLATEAVDDCVEGSAGRD